MQSSMRWLVAGSVIGAAAAIVPFVASAPAAPAPELVSVLTSPAPGTATAELVVAMAGAPVPAPNETVATALQPAAAAGSATRAARPGAPWLERAARHVIQPGETLTRIATRYGVDAEGLAAANGIADPNTVYAGQQLVVPPAGTSYRFHLVRPGETLASIARQHGLRTADLAAIPENGISDPSQIFAGQTLLITRPTEAGIGRLAVAEVAAAWPTLLFPPDGWTVDTVSPSFRWSAEGYAQLWIAPMGAQVPVFEGVLPKGQDSYSLGTQLMPGTTYRWRVRSNPFPPGDSVYTWTPWSREFTFTTPGGRSWKDGALVTLVAPVNGTIASTITPTLTWSPPSGSTFFEMTIIPASDPSRAVRFVQKIDTNTYTIPGPPYWYGMLPDTTYSWRVRVNNASTPLPEDHPGWGPWSDTWSFRTPTPSGNLIGSVTPDSGSRVASVTPTLAWTSADGQVFFYEVQVSKDSGFTVESQFAWAPLYWETVHGGMTSPPNSYTIPGRYPLERGQTYFWRVRPAGLGISQGAWSTTWQFTTP